MEPYEDQDCKCHEIEAQINRDCPGCDWNIDAACKAWAERSSVLPDNGIEFAPHSDEYYGCTCTACGRMVCGWCV